MLTTQCYFSFTTAFVRMASKLIFYSILFVSFLLDRVYGYNSLARETYFDQQENQQVKRRIISAFPCLPGYYYFDKECIKYSGNFYNISFISKIELSIYVNIHD